MNDYKALRTFLLAAEKRNFAQVARELDMTPAAVTRAIAALETELGVQLFVRTTRQVSLTTDGAIFAAQIQPAFKSLEDARREVMNAHKADEGRLRISAPTWFGKTVLPPILSGFKERYPKMSFEISLSDGLVNIVDDDYDLAIRISSQPSDKFTIWRKIRVVPRILVAAPGSRFADMQHPNELKPDDCLAYSGESRRENWVLSDGSSSITISAGRAFSANSGEVLADMAADGAGVALLPGFNIADHIESGRLVHVFKGWAPPDLWLTLFYPPYQALPPRIASFSKFFEEQVAAKMVMLD
ncbi:LysR family transcriptional regulator [Rhizobium lentis]|uniref:HTH-type transcriptional regulator TtuA n=1 Tax=Rhizobium lentis TaxID=1138194 RepID=A0A9Q3MD92_9HYPH|nr:LysR family transcriptional regulator [Rhizobium lentis]MBX4959536.1 LysR family transcriptional regulator [Rhizobium lentis]MBX4973312.1 LysR family transcriptional regulator [Rhizobium lentis]MBX4989668.1 LysR family transcriptional regulator [Rhizobium lentis]MBX5007985.1 LysR family transcriptional regulator [Rhizobium lentis]MBX5012408.1 LysR family transcriptional regulator [Rhizobium lentis]